MKRDANLTMYMDWLKEHNGQVIHDYHELWNWSVTDLESFWESLWEYFEIQSSQPYTSVLQRKGMPKDRWFDQARLNYTEHVFRNMENKRKHPAIIFKNEHQSLQTITWHQLHEQVAHVAQSLREMGVAKGDRVVAYLPNIPQAVVAFLATASIGAIWSSCSPDFGTSSVIDRFKQIEPKVLIAVDGYDYNGKRFDKRKVIQALQERLPTLEHLIYVPYVFEEMSSAEMSAQALSTKTECLTWSDLFKGSAEEIRYEQVPFAHPLWIVYSSGTTGLPKPIVHGQGGIILEHYKVLHLHCDLKPGDRFFWSTTTGWMMWNFLVGGLLVEATIVLYDGSPTYPQVDSLWELAEKTEVTLFGTGAPYLTMCMKENLIPKMKYSLSALKAIGSTASPLPPEGFGWVYQAVKDDVWLASVSGGTDVCTTFVGGSPILPVNAGEIQCRCLGVKAEAFNEAGMSVTDDIGELVITEPMPSMPIYFWDDPGDKRYLASYFDTYPGCWRHGDWVKISSQGSVVIYGRSDSTLNRQGIRIGTSELYRAVEDLEEVADSLVFDIHRRQRSEVLLFVVLKQGVTLDESFKHKLKNKIRTDLSPRHVPDQIFEVPDIPKTLNGKKMEVPMKKLFSGMKQEKAVNPDSMSNPHVLQHFIQLAEKINV